MKNYYKNRPFQNIKLPRPSWLAKQDALSRLYDDKQTLFNDGEIYYAQIVQANELLFNPSSKIDAPANVIFSSNPIVNKFPYLLKTVAEKLYSYKDAVGSADDFSSANDIKAIIATHKELLKADIILVSDTDMVSPDVPSITTGLRGLVKFEMRVTGPDHDLHSGDFGGTVSNPVNVLSWMIGTVLDGDGHITIPGFYDDVLVCSPEERELINRAPHSDEEYKRSVGVDVLHGEKGYTTLERIGIRPTFDVCGIQGGYSGEGFKTIIPSVAWAKLSFRLVANQNPERVARVVEEYFRSIAPESVKLEFIYYEKGMPYICPIDLEQELGLKSILLGFGLGADNIHAPNENYRLDRFFKGIETAVAFFQHYAEV